MTATHRGAAEASARDQVLRLGPDGRLISIVTRPARPPSSATPGVVILNAGVLHRVGPHRLHVILARALAERGVPSLRLDLGGIGDSTPSGEAATFRESAVLDTRIALAGIHETFGATRSVIFGVCAGADNAMATALVDDRVCGIVLVDPHVYASPLSRLRDLRARIQTNGIRAVATSGLRVARRIARARLEQLRRGATEPTPEEGREAPPVAEFRGQLATLVGRGVRVLAVYSGAHGAKYNAADQLFELFPELRGRVDRAYFPHANHTFTELGAQGDLVRTVVGWVTDRLH